MSSSSSEIWRDRSDRYRRCRGDRLPALLSNRVRRRKRTAGLGARYCLAAGRNSASSASNRSAPKVWPRRRTRIADDLGHPMMVDRTRSWPSARRRPASVCRHAVAIAIELQSYVFVDQSLDGVAIIRNDGWQLRRASGWKRSMGRSPRFAVQSPIGDLIQPTHAPGGSRRGGRENRAAARSSAWT